MLNVEQATEALLQALRSTEEYTRYDELRQLVAQDEAESALLRRFISAQKAVQLSAIAGQPPREEDASAFESLSALVYQSDALSDYLLARMRVQQLVAGTLSAITREAGLDVELPEC